ncbi:pseudouridine synthase [Haloplasma contractile]|uniref:Pseudouridine synthase n=1 Tax=Haloplasma contractile SSD-17B TaxID=1033810 RepID=U2DZJ2_9MOLU|nr:Pseudouridine synthase protein [Haloplasma contractile SSD-17B]
MRLDKVLANMGYGSRKEIKKIIKSGYVTVNNKRIKQPNTHIDEENDTIYINKELVTYKKFIYLMMNKPNSFISATKDGYHKTVIELLDENDRIHAPYPCGRLDIDTEGLLIISNDGDFAHRLTHPKKDVTKTYYVEVDQPLDESDKHAFSQGMELLDGNNNIYKTKPACLELKGSDEPTKAYVTISEGKFHQVKRMFKNVGKTVNYLKRISIGCLKLDESLGLGQYRPLTEEETLLLFKNKD